MAGIPDNLPWADVRRLINSIHTSDPVGKRDRALLILAATTGMRNGELRRLELGDIRWREGEIHLRRTKSRREHLLPLVTEAGKALSDYLLHGRPQTSLLRLWEAGRFRQCGFHGLVSTSRLR